MKISTTLILFFFTMTAFAQQKISVEAYATLHGNSGLTKSNDINHGVIYPGLYDSVRNGFTTYTRKNTNIHTNFDYKIKAGFTAGVRMIVLPENKLNFSVGLDYSYFSVLVKSNILRSLTFSTADTFVKALPTGWVAFPTYGDPAIDPLTALWNDKWQTFHFSTIGIPAFIHYNYKKWRIGAGITTSFLIAKSKTTEPFKADPESPVPQPYIEKNTINTVFNFSGSISCLFFKKIRIGVEYFRGLNNIIEESAVHAEYGIVTKGVNNIKAHRAGITVSYEINNLFHSK
jgi:Outer membrane protein beta-barrel domain